MAKASPAIRLSELTCVVCGGTDLAAVAPGTEPDALGGANADRGQPVLAWCWNCWPAVVRRRDGPVPHLPAAGRAV